MGKRSQGSKGKTVRPWFPGVSTFRAGQTPAVSADDFARQRSTSDMEGLAKAAPEALAKLLREWMDEK